ncbi:MAG: hypothetical protein U1G07_27150, partial [Verrucomicrobiota bacterium]
MDCASDGPAPTADRLHPAAGAQHENALQLSLPLRLMPMSEDDSNGYEGIASIYIARRGTRPL